MRPSDKIVATLKEYGGKMCQYAYFLRHNHYYYDSELTEEFNMDIDDINKLINAGEFVYMFAVKQESEDKISVTEQEPMVGGSIFCEVYIDGRRDGYFVCNSKRQIIQYHQWQVRFRRQLEVLGYKFNAV